MRSCSLAKAYQQVTGFACVPSAKQHFDAALVNRPLIPPLTPKKITRTKRDCENHLKLCGHYKYQSNRTKRQYEAIYYLPSVCSTNSSLDSTTPKISASSLVTVPWSSSQGVESLDMYFTQYHMSDVEVKTMEQMLIELIVDTAIPFNITDRPRFRRFVE